MNQYQEQADLGPYYSFSIRFRRFFRNALRTAFLFSIFWLGVGLPTLFKNAQHLFGGIPGAFTDNHVALPMRLIGISIVTVLGLDVLWMIAATTDSIGISSDALFGKHDFLDHPGLGRRALKPFIGPLTLFVAILCAIRIVGWVFPAKIAASTSHTAPQKAKIRPIPRSNSTGCSEIDQDFFGMPLSRTNAASAPADVTASRACFRSSPTKSLSLP